MPPGPVFSEQQQRLLRCLCGLPAWPLRLPVIFLGLALLVLGLGQLASSSRAGGSQRGMVEVLTALPSSSKLHQARGHSLGDRSGGTSFPRAGIGKLTSCPMHLSPSSSASTRPSSCFRSLRRELVSQAGFGADEEVVLTNDAGVQVHIVTTGAIVQRLLIPDREGSFADVVLGFDDLQPYKDGTSPYFGAVVGRVANRISGAKFELDGTTYNLSANDPPNSLHGGTRGWSRMAWSIVRREAFDDGGSSVTLEYISPHMEEGYPGKVAATVTYSLLAASTLSIEFIAESDAATPINMAQHAYFNLDGVERSGTILDHIIWINSSYVLPVDNTRIPTGDFQPVKDTPLDFTRSRRIGDRVAEVPGPPPHGYDINYALWGRDAAAALDGTRDCTALQQPEVAARVSAPASGRNLEVLTNSPGLQFYSGNMLDGSLLGKGGVKYVQYGGFALETQMFPNFINQPKFPQCILRPGQKYRTIDIWRFSTE